MRLTLVRGSAEAHGGQVHVESSADAGTTFILELPLDARPYQRASLDADKPPSPPLADSPPASP